MAMSEYSQLDMNMTATQRDAPMNDSDLVSSVPKRKKNDDGVKVAPDDDWYISF